jgi:hypothetical protein
VGRSRWEIAAVALGKLQPAGPRFAERPDVDRARQDVDRFVAAMALGLRPLTWQEVDATDGQMLGRDKQSDQEWTLPPLQLPKDIARPNRMDGAAGRFFGCSLRPSPQPAVAAVA